MPVHCGLECEGFSQTISQQLRTLSMCQLHVCLDPMKAIRTELSLTRDEFDSYNVGVDAEVTFCLKEFRVCVVWWCFSVKFKASFNYSHCVFCVTDSRLLQLSG